MRYDHLVEQYLRHVADSHSPRTLETYSGVLRRAQAQMPNGVVVATEQEIRDWLWVPGRKPKAIETYLAPIRSLHRYLMEREISDYDPTRLLPTPHVPKKLPRPVSEDEARRLVTLTPPFHRLCFQIAAYTGARVIEIGRLRREDFDLAVGGVLLDGKGDKERWVPLHPALAEVVDDLPAGWIIREETSRAEDNLGARLRRAMRKQGIPRGGAHRLRSYYAQTMLRAGHDLATVQDLLGHSSPTTTRRYAAPSSEQMRAAVGSLPDLLSRRSAAGGRADQAALPAHPPG